MAVARPRSAARGARRPSTWLSALLLLAWLAPVGRAHEGPPFPVLVDEPLPPWSVTVWADPDVGVGTFYVMLEPLDGSDTPDDDRVDVSVWPADGRLEPVTYHADREQRTSDVRHLAEVDFPTREFWSVKVQVSGAGGTITRETDFTVEVTPPGYGPIDLLLYVWPFVAIGLLWVLGMRRHSRQLEAEAAEAAEATRRGVPSAG